MVNIPFELFSTFNNIKFDDDTHSYYLNEVKLTSVTTLIHKYTSHFDEEYWAPKKASEYRLTSDNVKYAWTFLNEMSTFKGSALHNFIENYYYNKLYNYPKDLIINNFGYDPIFKEYLEIKNQFLNFYKDSFGKLISIRPEFIVYDEESKVSGMVDMLFYNKKQNIFEIWDWKTNKKLDKENRFQKMSGIFSDMDDCEFNVYSLQLNTYKYIIEKNTGVKLGDCYIVWFYSGNKNYTILKIPNLQGRVKEMLDEFKNKNL
jgi:ATP-dependent exoDNAse (exonuclease V) beta subunit